LSEAPPNRENPGVTARVQSRDGWAVRNAMLTVTDLPGQQAARADGDDDGLAVTGPPAPGTYTAIIMAPGYAPAARTAVVTASGSATLGPVILDRAGGTRLPPPGRWTIDPAHFSVRITARHMGLASVTWFIGGLGPADHPGHRGRPGRSARSLAGHSQRTWRNLTAGSPIASLIVPPE